MNRALIALFLIANGALLCAPFAHAARDNKSVGASKHVDKRKHAAPLTQTSNAVDSEAEARLIEIYRLIGQARTREALPKAESLVKAHPNFQLAQLVYGDLLLAQTRALKNVGDIPEAAIRDAVPALLADLRQESTLRLKALQERPAPGTVPSQFLALSPASKHAIAVDASRSRLYLFENGPSGLKLVGDFYISLGKSGIEKLTEGDLRTPLGVYFITSNLARKSLKDFYGSGALPINYPNQLDLRRGKTGGGIWLHGTPPNQFSRAPLATDGCVVLANPDLERLIKTVEVRTTPVVIAPKLNWVSEASLRPQAESFAQVLHRWHAAKASGDLVRLLPWYAPDFTSYGKTLAQWQPSLEAEIKQLAGRELQLKDLSYLLWSDNAETMVVTFGELAKGDRTGHTKRQYWVREGSQWKIFFEGLI